MQCWSLEAIKYVATITKPHVNVRKCISIRFNDRFHLEPNVVKKIQNKSSFYIKRYWRV